MSGAKNEEVTRGYRKPYKEWITDCHNNTVWSGKTHTHYMTILCPSRVGVWCAQLSRKRIEGHCSLKVQLLRKIIEIR